MSTSAEHPSSSDVETEAEGTRAVLASTLEKLRDNLKPEHVVDEVLFNARIGASTVADRFWTTAKEHPVPALLVVAGAAMMLGIGTRSARRAKPEPVYPEGADGLPRPRQLRRPTMLDGLKQEVSALVGGTDRSRFGVGGAPQRDTFGRPPRAAPQPRTFKTIEEDSMSRKKHPGRTQTPRPQRVGLTGASTSARLSGLFEEQPLILGVLGVAVGAAIGAALPATDTEDSWLGATSHSVKQAAQEVAHSQVEDLKAVASRAVDNVKQSASEHGLSTDNLSGLVKDVGSHAKTAVQEVTEKLDTSKAAPV